jgi:hypothetical protein
MSTTLAPGLNELQSPALSLDGLNYDEFLEYMEAEFLGHPIVLNNRYTAWFAKGEATYSELRYLAVQFSVFSNLFLIAQLKKMLNADSLESMRAAKEILANEIGVIFNNSSKHQAAEHLASDQEIDLELVSPEGSVEGGTFRFKAAHFEWLLRFAAALELGFNDVGKRWHGCPETLFFCDELARLYGSEDPSIAAGASFAIENWAAAGFWQELEDGLRKIKADRMPELPIAFFTWHNRLEAQHAAHTHDELAGVFHLPGFDRQKFLDGGREMLEGLAVFWNGLEDARLRGIGA